MNEPVPAPPYVLHHQHARLRVAPGADPTSRSGRRTRSPRTGRLAGPHPQRQRIADQRRQIRKQATHRRVHIAFVAQPHPGGLDRIGESAGIQPAQRFQLLALASAAAGELRRIPSGHLDRLLTASLGSAIWPGWYCPRPPSTTSSFFLQSRLHLELGRRSPCRRTISPLLDLVLLVEHVDGGRVAFDVGRRLDGNRQGFLALVQNQRRGRIHAGRQGQTAGWARRPRRAWCASRSLPPRCVAAHGRRRWSAWLPVPALRPGLRAGSSGTGDSGTGSTKRSGSSCDRRTRPGC